MTRTSVGVSCESCGLTSGHFDASGNARCDQCGQFASPSSDYCARHDVDVSRISGYDECPQCERERSAKAMEQELQERRADPQMHNMVDAQANAIDHSRSYDY